ncbi:MAG: hypothetical protein QM790_05745 [Nibricoccus sp.]
MHTSTKSITVVTSAQPSNSQYRWDGHMANDSANTVGPDPKAQLSASSNEICLQGTLGEFRIPKSAVKKITRGGLYPWVFMCIRIHHTLSNYPAHLQFKASGASSREVLDRLKSLGYSTS